MGRRKRWSEDMQARFPAGTFDRIDATSSDGEDRTDFVREAVERELARRWEAMALGNPADPVSDICVGRFRDPARITELTSAAARAAAPSKVIIPRHVAHALGAVSRRRAAAASRNTVHDGTVRFNGCGDRPRKGSAPGSAGPPSGCSPAPMPRHRTGGATAAKTAP